MSLSHNTKIAMTLNVQYKSLLHCSTLAIKANYLSCNCFENSTGQEATVQSYRGTVLYHYGQYNSHNNKLNSMFVMATFNGQLTFLKKKYEPSI